jgi:DNA-binding response OmpR family regulator
MRPSRYLLISPYQSLAREIVRASMAQGDELALARDSAEALQYIKYACPDAVFWEMDGSNEESVLECRRLRRHSPAPIVMLVSPTDRDTVVRGYRLGADAHIPIPCDRREFTARVAAVVRRSAMAAA